VTAPVIGHAARLVLGEVAEFGATFRTSEVGDSRRPSANETAP
jgi:hypothetical protein